MPAKHGFLIRNQRIAAVRSCHPQSRYGNREILLRHISDFRTIDEINANAVRGIFRSGNNPTERVRFNRICQRFPRAAGIIPVDFDGDLPERGETTPLNLIRIINRKNIAAVRLYDIQLRINNRKIAGHIGEESILRDNLHSCHSRRAPFEQPTKTLYKNAIRQKFPLTAAGNAFEINRDRPIIIRAFPVNVIAVTKAENFTADRRRQCEIRPDNP